ncbi:PREDICTED: uncharacterized protein LOC105563185 [Vollenhovia emeryi]|uniref:uncharacterized protein LOC105563185 n=1 Tax=Vollenhovia emeryi TaxID=411798 RepID=UPI0005F36C85|nr:PREDICTED: uncharacterized protein LOC105563185 [Vollenhovia emeryi]
MVKTRRNLAMEKAKFEGLSLEQLKEEANKYGLAVTGDRDALIQNIMRHLEKQGPHDLHDEAAKASTTGKPRKGSTGSVEQVPAVLLQQVLQSVQGMLEQAERKREQAEKRQQEQFERQRAAQQEQFERLMLLALNNGNQTRRDEPPEAARTEPGTTPIGSPLAAQSSGSSLPMGSLVNYLSQQIPEFAGGEDDNVQAWANRVDKVAQVHGASDGATLLAASSRLTKSARRWYELQTGAAIESWVGLRLEMKKMFERRVPFYKSMQKIEARKWQPGKESFDRYAIEKLALIQVLNLPEEDSIQLLIGGITNSAVKATALSMATDPLNRFLERMRVIAEGVVDTERKSTPPGTSAKSKEAPCRNCGGKGHGTKDCQAEPTCFYCKKKGHRRFECPALKRKDEKPGTSSATAKAAASVTQEPSSADEVVASVEQPRNSLEITDPLVGVENINGERCNLLALVDTGSPVSFAKFSVYERWIKPLNLKLAPYKNRLRNLSDQTLEVVGTVKARVSLPLIPNRALEVNLHVLKENTFEGDIILGREFLKEHKLTLIFKPTSQGERENVRLFAQLPLCVESNIPESLEETIDKNSTDLDETDKRKLKEVIINERTKECVPVDDGYEVQVRLKDTSTYSFSPRRFAYAERLQIREVVDDLLARGIVKPSTSPYCARVVPVRKRNGQMRLCIDLRPLNARVERQKYPFPVIEECLTRLSDKTIFTLLDLKDSFHQIKVEKDSTKYFAFATPDGQYEYTRLPFGFCESPAEFQKRLIQILRPLIRDDKVLIYMDDVLIASRSNEQNLEDLREVLQILRRYGFELNYKKCQFLKKEIEFLGYMISADGISLSPRHTDAIRNFKQPRTVLEVQRFLGLTNYFRRFIKGFAHIAKPIQDLVKRDVPFNFDDRCVEAFKKLKQELTSAPVLQLYNPAAPTELHTDACSTGLGGILLQKQKNNLWSPVAYYSQGTNQAEKRYHSYELEMLAIVRSVERFHLYLYGLEFAIVTDCNALVYAMNKANLNPRIARWTLMLQNYRFSVTHRPGKRMAHVDALSRCTAYVHEMPLERELELRQLTDPRILEISKKLELSEDKKFDLINGLVYKKDENQKKFVVPDSLITSLIRAHHDEMAHCGPEKTYKGIAENFWFPSMRKKSIIM